MLACAKYLDDVNTCSGKLDVVHTKCRHRRVLLVEEAMHQLVGCWLSWETRKKFLHGDRLYDARKKSRAAEMVVHELR